MTGGVSKLTVVHDRSRAPRRRPPGRGRLELVLSGLKTLLETGEPLQR